MVIKNTLLGEAHGTIIPQARGSSVVLKRVPFDTLVIFSTNFHPNRIFDKAALRRIFYKIKVDGPNQKDFLRIFSLIAKISV